MAKLIKSIQEKEKNEKKSFFDLGRNPMEIVHRISEPYLVVIIN